MDDKLATITNLFEGKEIRSIWDKEKEEYYFSVVDVIAALTDANIPKRYWTDLKRKLVNEGSEVYEKIVRLKLKASEYKEYKGIRKESLRDNMTDIEVVLTDLGEVATRELAKEHKPYGLEQNKKIAQMGGSAAKAARDNIENNLGKTIISNKNSLNYQ